MRGERRHRAPRLALPTCASAAGLGAVVAAAAFGLQALALPRPSEAQLIATKTERWLTRHDALESVSKVGSRTISSICVDVSVREYPLLPKRTQASILVAKHVRLVATHLEIFRVGRTLRDQDGAVTTAGLIRAGCPRVLEFWLGKLLDHRVAVRERLIRFDRHRALRLQFGRADGGLVLIVAPRTFAPVAVRLRGWARLAPANKAEAARSVLGLSFVIRHKNRKGP
ncbi:MAG TPA: hypothetical protein VF002_05770 [Gaiellaceae bacterium]